MLKVFMEKDVTLMKDLSAGRTAVWDCKYKDLETELINESEIEVNYCFGKSKLRHNKLNNLSYSLKETIFFNDEEPWGKIKQVWVR